MVPTRSPAQGPDRPKSVQFDASPEDAPRASAARVASPHPQRRYGSPRRTLEVHNDDDHDSPHRNHDEVESRHKHRRRHSAEDVDEGRHRDPRRDVRSPDKEDRGKRRHRKRRARSQSPGSEASGQTVELPDRFDKDGKKRDDRGEDPLADKIEELLQGKGLMGRFVKRFTDPGR